jgi:hypothetical protein
MAVQGDVLTAKWLSRRQVALVLGITVEDVAKLDGNRLHPVKDRGRCWRYDSAEIRSLMGSRGGQTMTTTSTDGEVTAAAFELFEQGKSLPQVVIATRQTAACVSARRREYDEMTGALLLPAAVVHELASLLGRKREELSAEALVEAIRSSLAVQFRLGQEEGRPASAAVDFGEIVDPITGQRRRVIPANSNAASEPPAMKASNT